MIAPAFILIGILLTLLLGVKGALDRFRISPIGGYLVIGWFLRMFTERTEAIPVEMERILYFLAQIGITLLLFHIGLETHLKRLFRYLGQAGIIALSNILLSAFLGIGASLFFGFSLGISLFVGLALTATSIGVSTSGWNEKELTQKKVGILLLDIVTIDDILSVFFVAFLLSFIPLGGASGGMISISLLIFLLKISCFLALCFLFSHFLEPLLMKEFIKYEKMPDAMLSTVGIGLLIAGLAAFLGFSFAIGAFFAGIAFSRDPKVIKIDLSMKSLLDFFTPFFFFWIGYQTSITSLEGIWPFFLVLLVVAIVGKLFGTYLPAKWTKMGSPEAWLLSLSTIPRAEVAMVIMEFGLEREVLSESIYSAMSLLCLLTSFFTPLFLRYFRSHVQLSS